MYAMCTGRPPFRAETSYGILRRITDTEPRAIREVNPSIPEWLERIIQRLLSKSLDDRIPTADHVATLLQKCLAHLQQPTVVELPDECRVPVLAARSPIRLITTCAASVLFLCFCFAELQFDHGLRGYFYEAAKDESAGTENPEVPQNSDESKIELSNDDSVTKWDSTQTEIDVFDKELGPSESDAGKLWQITSEAKPP